MHEPTTNPTSQATTRLTPSTEDFAAGSTAPRATGLREFDHNDHCLGCGADRSDPCTFDCFFECGELDAGVVLRTAAHRLVVHPDGCVDIHAAITTAVAHLTGAPAQDGPVHAAHTVLGDYLQQHEAGAEVAGSLLILRLTRRCTRSQVARTLYAVAASHDGCEFDPDEFGDLA